MILGRLTKLFAAQNVNQLVLITTQLLLPPVFLKAFGASLYGQWIALSAAVSSLGVLNYGLQTYTNMQMAIHYNRGEIEECRQVQSGGLRVMLVACAAASILLLAIFLIPVTRWLNLSISTRAAQWTLYWLGIQVMATMLCGFFSGCYMVFAQAHRGAHLSNINQLSSMLVMVLLVFMRQSFPVIAASQIVMSLGFTLYFWYDVSARAPALKPSLQYWKTGSLRDIIVPSLRFFLLATSNIISYQLPLLLMQVLLGPAVVVVYSVTRTMYSMSRRILYMLTNTMGPELTVMYGRKDWGKLHTLYVMSESIILFLVPPITFGSMFASPLLLHLWLHKESLFDPGVCALLGVTISVLGIKEHKYQFQFSSNRIAEISRWALVVYAALFITSIPMMKYFGLQGFLLTWLVFETGQLLVLLKLNDQIFEGHVSLDHQPVYRLLVMLLGLISFLLWPLHHIQQFTFGMQFVISASLSGFIAIVCYRVFNVRLVRMFVWPRINAKLSTMLSKQWV